MMLSPLLAALLFLLPKTSFDPALKGWETNSSVPLPYAAACQHLVADMAAQGLALVRTETVATGTRAQEARKFANAEGDVVIFLTWRLGASLTGYACRRDRIKGKQTTP